MVGRAGPLCGAVAMFLAMTVALPADAQRREDWRAPAGREWPVNGGDWGNTRFTSLSQITPGNVGQLGAAWTRNFPGEASRSIPVVQDGVMYVTTTNKAWAIDARDGRELWSYEPPVKFSNLFKGFAVGGGKAFIGLSDSQVIALDAKTGKFLWQSMVGDPADKRDYLMQQFKYPGAPDTGQYISAAPTYANGIVVAAMANGDYGIRGRVAGFDARTGKRLWAFDTVAAPGQVGGDTWPKDSEVYKKGGAGVWMTPTIDPDLGLVYFGTGNALPYYAGELRPGDNLFTTSVVAVDLKTGKYKWHFQVIRHDLWEYDIATPVILFDHKGQDGKARKALAVMRADGHLFILDRANGRPIIPVEERPVRQSAFNHTSPTQPYPVGADQLVPNCVDNDVANAPGFELGCYFDPPDLERPNVLIPANATRMSPMSYSPATGQFYVFGGVGAQWQRRWKDPWMLRSGGPVPGIKRWGMLTAIDASTDKIAWQVRLPQPSQNGSGGLATASGLLFHGEQDGNLQAFDVRDGKLLWQFQTGLAISAPVVSYELDGQQMIAFVGTDATVWAFRLGGQIAQKAAPTGPVIPANRVGTLEGGAPLADLSGRISSTDKVEIGVLVKDTGLVGIRHEIDEYQFGPQRARVKAGTSVTWTNKGEKPHQPAAADGSWQAPVLQPGQSASVKFDKPGSHRYVDRLHPFMYGELIVE